MIYRHSLNGLLYNKHLHTPYSALFRMTLSDLERLSKIFNDTKRRVVSATAEFLIIPNL